MKTFEDLKSFKVYPKGDRLYIPIDEENKRKGSLIMLLGHNNLPMEALMDDTMIINNNLYNSYYIEKGIQTLVQKEDVAYGIEEEVFLELLKVTKDNLVLKYTNEITDMNKHIIEQYINDNTYTEYNRFLGNQLPKRIKISIQMYNKPIVNNSNNDILQLCRIGVYDIKTYGPYEYYLKHELVNLMLRKVYPDAEIRLITAASSIISGQYDEMKKMYGGNPDIKLAGLLNKVLKTKGKSTFLNIIKKNDYVYLAKFAANENKMVYDIKHHFQNNINDLEEFLS